MGNLIEDARTLFDNYLQATSVGDFKRLKELGPQNFLYFEAHLQSDTAVFAGVLAQVWEELKDPNAFPQYFKDKSRAFGAINEIIVPQKGHADHARFWSLGPSGLTTGAPWSVDVAFQVCRTLRNGFSHFHFRCLNKSPADYFAHMNLPLPSVIPDPAVTDSNYRVFVCDWNPKKDKTTKSPLSFMDAGSDTRIVETHFAHLRYQLFRFLVYFFMDRPGQYTDILTNAQMT